MGRRTFQVWSVSGDFFFLNIFFFFFFFFLVVKNDFPKNTEISRKSDIFQRKILEKDFQLLSKIYSQFSLTYATNGWFDIVLANYKKKKTLPKWKIWVRRACKAGFFCLFLFLFLALGYVLKTSGHACVQHYYSSGLPCKRKGLDLSCGIFSRCMT